MDRSVLLFFSYFLYNFNGIVLKIDTQQHYLCTNLYPGFSIRFCIMKSKVSTEILTCFVIFQLSPF